MTEKMKWANQRAIFMVEMGTGVILHRIHKKSMHDGNIFWKKFGKLDLTEK